MKKLLSIAFALMLAVSCMNAAVFASDAEDTTVIRLSDSGITVGGKTAPTDETAAVYTAHDIVYYEAGKGFTYGEGTAADEHDAGEAAAHTVVHITQPGTYTLSGSLSAGQIAVDLGKDAVDDPNAVVTLILNGVDITCTVAPAVIFYNVYECGSTDAETAVKDVDTSAAGARVVIADDTVNHISGSYVARIYKSYTLSEDGTQVTDSKKLHKYDGAFYSKMSMNIDGGTRGTGVLDITAENEGLDSELHLTINGGNIKIHSGNDGINTNEDGVSVTTINGGSLTIDVTGETGEGDGIDSNGWLVINGGTVIAAACGSSMDAGIDSDMGIYLNGGTVIATGNMYDRIDGGNSNYAVFSFAQRQSGGTAYSLKSAAGETIAEFTPANDFTYLIYASPELTAGNYTFWQGNTQLAGLASSGAGGPGGGKGDQAPPAGFDPSEVQKPDGAQGQRPEGMPEPPQGGFPEGMPEFPRGDLPEGQTPEAGMMPPDGSRPGHFGGDAQSGSRTKLFAVTAGGSFFTGLSAATDDDSDLPFSDVAPDSWCYEAVKSAYEEAVITGTSATAFSPDKALTRGQAVTILWRLEGSPVVNYAMNFSDVTENTDCAEAVRWAASRGIAQGYSSGAFGVSDPVTREQFAALLYRCAQSKGQGFTGTWAFPLNYPDAQQVSGFAYEPLCWLTMSGVISGTNSGMLNPQGTATRAQAVVMLQRYLAL